MAVSDIERGERLAEYLEFVTRGLGRVERRAAMRNYAQALLLPGERKSILPLAGRIAPTVDEVEAYRQRMQQAVAVAQWDENIIYKCIAEKFSASVADVDAVVFDDTGFAKKGKHSPCVQRQYSGTLGRVDNCQVAVSVHLASDLVGVCIGMQLYMPESWANDEYARKKAHIPGEISYQPKWKIALNMLKEREDWDISDKVVLADSGYGDSYGFRAGLEKLDRTYLVGISESTAVWAGGRLPTPPSERINTGGRPIVGWSRDIYPETVVDIALAAKASEWNEYEWTNGQNKPRTGDFLAVRIRHAYRSRSGYPPGDEQWLLIQRDEAGKPSKFWLSNLAADEDIGRLIYLAKLRWRIERDYQEMKGELGLDHFEGRTWQGFHHHCALVAAAHAFLALERALFPPRTIDGPGVSSPLANRALG